MDEDLALALFDADAIRFGEFTLKSQRRSPIRAKPVATGLDLF